MQSKTILTIFLTALTTSGCSTVPPPAPHPELTFPAISKLPNFTRKMLDCNAHLPLCRMIKKREAVLTDEIETRDALLRAHNEALKK